MQWFLIFLVIIICLFWGFFKWVFLLLGGALLCLVGISLWDGVVKYLKKRIGVVEFRQPKFDSANPCGATGHFDPRHPDYQSHRAKQINDISSNSRRLARRIKTIHPSALSPKKPNHAPNPVTATGGVYLIKSGPYYKIGKTKTFDKRIKRIALQQPEKVEVVHKIYTENMSEVERNWHKRFARKKKNGEWFELSAEEVEEFKKQSRM